MENYYLIDDERLTWTAKGVAGYLQRHPGATAEEIAAAYKGDKRGNGIKAVRAALEELRETGVIENLAMPLNKDEDSLKILREDLNSLKEYIFSFKEELDSFKEHRNSFKEEKTSFKEGVVEEKITYSDGMLIVTEEAMEDLARRYPSADLQTELNKIEDWMEAHPKRKHKSLWLFTLNWLRRSSPMEEQPRPMTEFDRITARLDRRDRRIMENREAKGYSRYDNDGLPTDPTTYDSEGYPVAVQG